MGDIAHIEYRILQGRLDRIVHQLLESGFSKFRPPSSWVPQINAYLCEDKVTVCVDLAGVEAKDVSLELELNRLIVSGRRQAPEPCGEQAGVKQILSLEIDQGPFRRVIDLPVEVNTRRAAAEQRNGMLWVTLPLCPEA